MAYINTDVIACLKKELCELECKPDKISGIKARFLRRITSQIEGYKTADVTEVKHAKWEINSDGYYPYCSNCKTEPENGIMSKHCPECGAKMDGGKENERSVMDIDM